MQDTQARQLLVAEARQLALIHGAIDGALTGRADVDSRPVSDGRGPGAVTLLLEQEVEESLRRAVDDERAEVAFALTRLDQGTFGICVACGAAIPDERLGLMPATRFCVTCEAAGERSFHREQGRTSRSSRPDAPVAAGGARAPSGHPPPERSS